jgi:hypothetical protein
MSSVKKLLLEMGFAALQVAMLDTTQRPKVKALALKIFKAIKSAFADDPDFQ